MHIIVDGYNLIRQSDVLRGYERRSLEEGRKALLRTLAGYRKIRGHKITVVFDGWQGGSPVEERDLAGGVEIIYSRLGEKADEVIKRLIGEEGGEIMVVTSDRGISDFATHRGKTSMASPAFESLIGRVAAGPIPEAQPDDGEEEDRGAKKKGPSRRLSKQQRAALVRIRKL